MESNWIPVADRLPEAEKEVLITAVRKYKDGERRYIVTTAMHEPGNISEYDSIWRWEDIESDEWDEENDCPIIPEGWWECKHYNQDDVWDNPVDNEVIAWMPKPEPYQPEEPKEHEQPWKQSMLNTFLGGR